MYPADKHLPRTFEQTVSMGAHAQGQPCCQPCKFCGLDMQSLRRFHRECQSSLGPVAPDAKHKHRCRGPGVCFCRSCTPLPTWRSGRLPALFCYNCDEYLATCPGRLDLWLTAPGLFDNLAPGARVCRECLRDLRGSLLLNLVRQKDGDLTLSTVGGRALLVITWTDPQPGDNVWTFPTHRSISSWVQGLAFGCFIAESDSLAPIANDGRRYQYQEFVNFYPSFLRHWATACLRSYRLIITVAGLQFDTEKTEFQDDTLFENAILDLRWQIIE